MLLNPIILYSEKVLIQQNSKKIIRKLMQYTEFNLLIIFKVASLFAIVFRIIYTINNTQRCMCIYVYLSILLKLNCCVFVCLFVCLFVRIVLERWRNKNRTYN